MAERFKFATVDRAKIESEIVASRQAPTENVRDEAEKESQGTEPPQSATPSQVQENEINDPQKVVDDLLGQRDDAAQKTGREDVPVKTEKPVRKTDTAKPAHGKEDKDTRPLAENAPAKNPSAPTSTSKSKSAKGFSRPSVREELREISAAKKEKEATAPARDAERNSRKSGKKGNRSTTHTQPQGGRKPKNKKTKER